MRKGSERQSQSAATGKSAWRQKCRAEGDIPPWRIETRELAAIEKSVWEGWMNRDGKKLDGITPRERAFVNIFGGYFTYRAYTLKNWTENPCEIKSLDVADAGSASVTADTSVLVHKGTAYGTCFGQEVGPFLPLEIHHYRSESYRKPVRVTILFSGFFGGGSNPCSDVFESIIVNPVVTRVGDAEVDRLSGRVSANLSELIRSFSRCVAV
jgi:hypothetical protein